MFEIKHLKTILALADAGNIKKAADSLFISQSALSHQIKDLEHRLNTILFIRNTLPIQFTAQGEILLQLAQRILPKINDAQSKLRAEVNPPPELKIAIACHACFQWLVPTIQQFSTQSPTVNISFQEQIFSTGANENKHQQADILFTDEIDEDDSFIYKTVGRFEVVAILAPQHEFREKPYISKADFNQQTLLTYPVKAEELDIFKLFLNNKSSQPKAIKQVANSHVILQMVAANMGLATFPDWLVKSLSDSSLIHTKRLGKKGVFKNLYARYKIANKQTDIIEQLLPHTIAAFHNLYKRK